jgi:Txe/YoeB family toxin of Txe-Axe toxin-antitoxin module
MLLRRYCKRVLVIFASIIITYFTIFTSTVYAVTPWSGNPWKGNSWKGTPWDAGELQWEGVPWNGNPINGNDTDTDTDSLEDSSSDKKDAADSSENNQEKMCLPGDGGCNGTSKETLDLSSEKNIDKAIEQFIKDNTKKPFFMSKKAFEKEVEKLKKNLKSEFTRLLDRPHGTVQDVDIPDNILATLAQSGYSENHLGKDGKQEKDNKLSTYGWKEYESVEYDSGFHARVYKNDEEGKIVVSFGGTETDDMKDLLTDGRLALGYSDDQFEEALKFVNDMMLEHPEKEIVITGHSLGGALAQYVAIHKGIPAITFNAPGIDTRDYGFFENPFKLLFRDGNMLDIEKYLNKYGLLHNLVENHIMEDDPIGSYQIHVGSTYSYSGDGTVICRDDYSDEIHKRDLPSNKVPEIWSDFKNDLPNHGMNKFFEMMVPC